ncbi:MAG: hypothetical protein QM756_38920 [Polyangiaceae bacterium]
MTQAVDVLVGNHTNETSSRAEHSRQSFQVVSRALSALGLAAVWGIAAGAGMPLQALANAYKVPMVLGLSLLLSLPAVFVTRHLLQSRLSALTLLDALVSSTFRASLLLIGFAPLLMLYAYTSRSAAPLLAQGSALTALAFGASTLVSRFRRLEAPPLEVIALGVVSLVSLALALWQLVALATPVLTMPTVFGAGIDGVLK